MSETYPIVYQPSQASIERTRMYDYMRWLDGQGHGHLADYEALHEWSVAQPAAFWQSLWRYTGVIASQDADEPISAAPMPNTQWFVGARLNFAENMLREALHGDADKLAIVGLSEAREPVRLTYGELLAEVGAFEAWLVAQGVGEGDRVAGVVAHTHEPIVAMLACASIGAIWSSASPDFGINGIVDRFAQIEPTVLVMVDGYRYGGKDFDRRDRIDALCEQMPSIQHVVVTANSGQDTGLPDSKVALTHWADALAFGAGNAPSFSPGPFDRPVYILFSSGTTGRPKCIVHGAGGALLQHSKELMLHGDIGREDVFFYFTTCGWMMWNWLASGLVTGATLVLYDGNPGYPDFDALWAMAEREGVTHFGTSAKWLAACRNAQIEPGQAHDLSRLRVIFSTGSPLLPADYDWVYTHVKTDVLLGSISGGTDIVSSFVGCCPLLPVRRGEIQCRLLGVAAEAFNDAGEAVVDECGELVCTQALPSMPVKFWNDPNGERYHAAYFERFAGVWAHGDYVLFNAHGGAVILGRSDATLNVGGIRIGTAEIYRQIEPLEAIADSLVVAQQQGDDERTVLFVVLAEGYELDDALASHIRKRLKDNASPRHVPGLILAVDALPYTRSGKKVEVAVAHVVNGRAVNNTEAIANPESLDQIARHPGLEMRA